MPPFQISERAAWLRYYKPKGLVTSMRHTNNKKRQKEDRPSNGTEKHIDSHVFGP